MSRFITVAKKFYQGEEAATMVEYGLMVALIAVVCIGAVTFLGTSIKALFGGVGSTIGSIPTTAGK